MNSLLFSICMMCLFILLLIFLLRKLRQPYMIAYIMAGIVFGPHVAGVFTNTDEIAALGEIGLLLLMFFLGMELDIPDQRSLLLKPLIAQGIKIVLSIAIAIFFGALFSWSAYNITVLAMLFVFNSTAVISEYLARNNELQTMFGKMLLNILLLQDLLLAPVLTIFQFMGREDFSQAKILISIAACVLIIILVRAARHRNFINPAALKDIGDDHELQVFLGGLLSLGLGFLAELAGQSGAIGSFLAGMVVGRTQSFQWLEHALKPFRIFFICFFFMSIGLRLDLPYITANSNLILAGTLLVLISNSLISALVFRLLRYNWRQSFYGGALLSQTGEFGMVACTLAYKMEIIDVDFFKTAIAITALTLLFSTTWITILKKMVNASAH